MQPLNIGEEDGNGSKVQARKLLRVTAILFLTISVMLPGKSQAIAIDLLGEAAKPLINVAKDKTQGFTKYIWLQPYGGYAFGNDHLPGTTTGSKIEGLFFGGRGGLKLFNSLRAGVDYTLQRASYEDSAPGGIRRSSLAKYTMLGALVSFDIPSTPFQAVASRYFESTLSANPSTSGTGWGAGITFVIINPIILITEYRWANLSSEMSADGIQTGRSMRQLYIALSFMLL